MKFIKRNFVNLTYIILGYILAIKFVTTEDDLTGAFPETVLVSQTASVEVNATCGQLRPEVYCTLSSAGDRCGVCDGNNPHKNHPIEFAFDLDESSWWQSPSLYQGLGFQYISLVIDLKQTFQVAYITIKTAISPKPVRWILERSVDGNTDWLPWQYFAESDQECWLAFGIEPNTGKPSYVSDDEVICTSYYAAAEKLEYSQIHVDLLRGRPGVNGPSQSLLDFTMARFIRIRFQRMRIMSEDIGHIELNSKNSHLLKKYFYTIQDVSIGGKCPCNGHSTECLKMDHNVKEYRCKCLHNTCGLRCDECCSMYNQKRWRPGKFISANSCEKCQCYGHAKQCFFDPQIEAKRKSINIEGVYEGGGVCIDCKDRTTGVNCDQCLEGFYRPIKVSKFSRNPCRPCNCPSFGSYENVCHSSVGLRKHGGFFVPGDCICKDGYAGSKCTQCDRGFFNYPRCRPCPCNVDGTLNEQCSGQCLCKANVMGERCDTCRPGFFALTRSNPQGCVSCFCYGVVDVCHKASLGVEVINIVSEGWLVTDLRRHTVVKPYWSSLNNGVTIAEEDVYVDNYFWEAPLEYIGNKLTSYGQTLHIKCSWHTARGDTAGSAMLGPNVILQGDDGVTIGHGAIRYLKHKNATIHVTLLEDDWYHIPVHLTNIRNDVEDAAEFQSPKSVNKVEFMKVIGSLNRLLIRAKFHHDQLESTLHIATMQYGSLKSLNIHKTVNVEQCKCPLGYEGLSCERCSYGYTRIDNLLYGGECKLCNCNGHAAMCDPYSLKCGQCQHNTFGDHCERCIEGYYGNALHGTPDDCRPCKCPLSVLSNNFSPTCKMAPQAAYVDRYFMAPEEFICDSCHTGYSGDHCERCSNGYFGNPLSEGDFCKACDCSGNADLSGGAEWCDHRTGQCLRCSGNTSGWNCHLCQDGFYGSALSGTCLACNCNPYGSLSNKCDSRTGQCYCKKKYVGLQCDKCKNGFGNVQAGCRECSCNEIGSISKACNAETGQCKCQPGVTGLTCDICASDRYGFSSNGCTDCSCYANGSLSQKCDSVTGQCRCKYLVVGRKCDKCQNQYWNINSMDGCQKCNCNEIGSVGDHCDTLTGQCVCHPGVGGLKCDGCLVGHWGFFSGGCAVCSSCSDRPGRICDPYTGRCVCPPLTTGLNCEQCVSQAWNYSKQIGCTNCNCHETGSVSNECHILTGRCRCMTGFDGFRCDRCSYGYYNFPNCRPCNCDPGGTIDVHCNAAGKCRCDMNGICKCKDKVEGKKCSSCKLGSFGLSRFNHLGCIPCFCFGRTKFCTQAQYTWTQMACSGEDRRTLIVSRGETPLNESQGLLIIPSIPHSVVTVGVTKVRAMKTIALYWNLPKKFLGDRILSYNGFIRFIILPKTELKDDEHAFPFIQIISGHKIVLHHYITKENISGGRNGRYAVRLHEKSWFMKGSNHPLSREIFMIGLQDVRQILIRAVVFNSVPLFSNYIFQDVTLDIAKPNDDTNDQSSYLQPALGIEQCQCPKQYSSTSCQDPGPGYYLIHSEFNNSNTLYIDQLIGYSKKCQCNNRAIHCDSRTGRCLNCTNNTSGKHCDMCASGFFNDGNNGSLICKPCQCPTSKKNFADSCSKLPFSAYICQCRPGYVGPTCDRCDFGYYGSPMSLGGTCLPCNCDLRGSRNISTCDSINGQCYCVDTVIGRDCSQCASRHILSSNGSQAKCADCDNLCTGILLTSISKMLRIIKDVLLDFTENRKFISTPLNRFQLQVVNLEERLVLFETVNKALSKLDDYLIQIWRRVDLLHLRSHNQVKTYDESQRLKNTIVQYGADFETTIEVWENKLNRILNKLQHILGANKVDPSLKNWRKKEAKKIHKKLLKIGFQKSDVSARSEMGFARQMLKHVQKVMYNDNDVAHMMEVLDELDRKINNIIRYIDRSMSYEYKSVTENLRINTTLAFTVIECNNIDLIINKMLLLITQSERFLNKTKHILAKTVGFLTNLIIKKTENKSLQVLDENLAPISVKCLQNSKEKIEFSKILSNLYESTVTQKIRRLLKAGSVYKNIIGEINNAKTLAVNSSVMSNQTLLMTRSLRNKSEQIRINSEDIRQDLNGLRANILDISQNFTKLNQKIKEEWKIIENTWKKITKMTKYYREPLTVLPSNVTNRIKDVSLVVEKLFHRSSGNLKSKADVLRGSSPQQLKKLSRFVKKSMTNLFNSEKQAMYIMDYLQKRVLGKDAKVFQLLSQIKDAIKAGFDAISSIRLSFTNAVGYHPSGCYRNYDMKSLDHHSIISSISLTLANTNTNSHKQRNDSLLIIKNSNSQEYMSISLIGGRQILFSWDVGAGRQSVTHKVEIETAINLAQDDIWYKITAERIGNIGRLNVRKLAPIYDTPDYHLWTVGESPSTAHVFDLETNEISLTIGGSDGVVFYDAKIDDQQVGLWNFLNETKNSCVATMAGISTHHKKPERSCYAFGETSYAVQRAIEYYDSKYLSFSLELKSFDENSLILFAINWDLKNKFIYLGFQNGCIVFRISYSSHKILRFVSTQIYNTGDWIKVEAARALRNGVETGILRIVTAQGQKEEQTETIDLDPNSFLNLQDCHVYIGGVPKNFDVSQFGNDGFHFGSFVGVMRDITVSNPGSNNLLNPLYTKRFDKRPFFGIEPSCQHRALRYVSFKGNGFLELDSHPLIHKKVRFGFSFRTSFPNGLILLLLTSSAKAIFLSDGFLNFVLLNSTNNEQQLVFKSISKLNDNVTHTFFVVTDAVNGSSTVVYLDETSYPITSHQEIKIAIGDQTLPVGGLFLGGVPPTLKTVVSKFSIIVSDGFIGTIFKLAFIDQKFIRIVEFSKPVSFMHAAIGRSDINSLIAKELY